MKRFATTLVAACLTTACTESSGTPQPDVVTVPGDGGAFSGVAFTMTGPTMPGSVQLTDAYYLSDDNSLPAGGGIGSGSMSITVGDQAFVSSDLEAVWTPLMDDDGSEFIGVGGVQVRSTPSGDRMEQVIIVVPRSDVASGATVELDGEGRFVLFASGDPEDEPDLWAAAISGTVTFGADIGTNPDELISASVEGDFGPIEIVDDGSSGRPSGGSAGPLPSGSYTLTVHERHVGCDGTMTGREDELAGIDASVLGISGGTVTVTSSPATLAGAALSSALFTSTAPLEDFGDGVWGYYASRNDPNFALGTTRSGVYVLLDGVSASASYIDAFIGSDLETADGQGYCGVGYQITLTQ